MSEGILAGQGEVEVHARACGAVDMESSRGAMDEESAHGAVDVESALIGAVEVESAHGAGFSLKFAIQVVHRRGRWVWSSPQNFAVGVVEKFLREKRSQIG